MFLRTLSSLFVTGLVLATAATGCAAADTEEEADAAEGAASAGGDSFATLSVARDEIDEEVTIGTRGVKLHCILDATHISVGLRNTAAAAAINRVLTPNPTAFVSACQARTGPENDQWTTRMEYNGAGILSVKRDSYATQRMTSGEAEGRLVLITSHTGLLFDLSNGRLLGVRDVFDAGGMSVVQQACARELTNVHGDDAANVCRTALARTGPDDVTVTFSQFSARFWLDGSPNSIDVPWAALRGHILHEGVKKIPSTATQPDICMAFPNCDGGDHKVGTSSSQCLQDIGCYSTSQCGRTIWCSDDQTTRER